MRCAALLAGDKFRAAVDIVTFQDADLEALGLTAHDCSQALHAVKPDGSVAVGAAAVAAALGAARAPWPLVARVMRIPGIRWLAERIYRWVANHRSTISGWIEKVPKLKS